MSEPYWIALGSVIPIEYIGGWSAEVSYKPGDIVTHNGVDYIAVNPSTNSPPPPTSIPVIGIGTSLPVSPFNGQEFVLVDSLTAPSYQWRFRYTQDITDAYKWVFIGGNSPLQEAGVISPESTASTAYVNLATLGPSIVIPRAGYYLVEVGAFIQAGGSNTTSIISYDIGATPASDQDGAYVGNANTYTCAASVVNGRVKLFTVSGTTLLCKYRTTAGTAQFQKRWIKVTPVRVS